jgi:hypothetical protein
MARDIVWEWLDRPGLEHLSIEIGPAAIRAQGLVLVQLGTTPVRVAYAVDLDGSWRFERARLTVERDGGSKVLAIERAADGRWTVDGQARPDLAPCIDIDIMATPFTNSLPIRRLRFEPDRAQTLWMAYIRLPELTVEPAAQDYTRLDAADPPTRFRYRSRATGFTAELEVDDDGLVLEYPGIWRRRSGMTDQRRST